MKKTVWIGALLVGMAGLAHAADEDVLQVIQMKTVLEQIPALKWTAKTTKIEVVNTPRGEEFFVSVPGSFKADDWTLLSDADRIPVTAQGEVTVKIPVTGETSTLDLLAISPLGELKREKIGAFFPGYKAFIAKRKAPAANARRLFFTPSLGFTYAQYKQTNLTPFSETALTTKVSALYYLAPRWDIGMSSFFTALPLSSSVHGSSIRFLGVNGRFGYVVPGIRAPWRLSLMAGIYYTTTFVPAGAFGFENMAGPQLFPVLTRVWGKGQMATFYFKFSPVTNRLTPLALTNREMAGGGSYGWRLSNGHLMSVTLDVADIKLNVLGTQAQATTYSIGTGYAF